MSLSKEYVSDSSDDEHHHEQDAFAVPDNYKQCKHLKKFHAPDADSKKEVWLIKAPKSLDFGKLKTLPIDFSGDSGSTIELGPKSYSVREDLGQEDGGSSGKYTFMTPNDKQTLAIDASLQIGKFFTISETVQIPEICYDKVRVPREDVVKVGGLKLRHFATGYDGEEGQGHEQEEQEDQPPLKKHKKDKKDKKEKKDKKKKKKD